MQSAEKIFTFIFELSGWTPSCLENKEASLSNYLKPLISSSVNCGHMAANQSAGCAARFMNIGRKLMWLLPQKVVGLTLKPDQPNQ